MLNGIDLEVAQGRNVFRPWAEWHGQERAAENNHRTATARLGLRFVSTDRKSPHCRCKQLNEIRKKIGFLFQNSALYDSLTVEQNVAFPLERHSQHVQHRAQGTRPRTARDRWDGERFGQAARANLRRDAKARGVGASLGPFVPTFSLFDEPTAGLDPITASEIDALILKMQKEGNMTSIVVTHDLPSARTVSDRLALMRDGQILIEGSFKDLQASKDEFVVQFLNRMSLGGDLCRAHFDWACSSWQRL